MKTIGFVCEGPRDSDMLEAVIRHIVHDEITPLYIQPEASLVGEKGNGWKGVWTWCFENGETLDQYMQGAIPKIDLIVVQMDGDVARKEREVHCVCYSKECDKSGALFPIKCKMENCPIQVPCIYHEEGVAGYVDHIRNIVHSCFTGEYIPVCVVPCDTTDAWIVAAFEDLEDVESVEDPWTNIISKRKDYHGIRVPGHKKTKAVYEKLVRVVCQNWELVKERCPQAADFDQVISQLQ